MVILKASVIKHQNFCEILINGSILFRSVKNRSSIIHTKEKPFPVRVVTSGPLPIAEMEHACVLLGCSSHFGDCSCYLSSVNVVAGAWAFSAAGACGEHLTGSLTIWCCQTLAARICGFEGRCYYCSVGANFVGGNFEAY